jgi:UDP-N-acetylmuramyl pentapeptide synthase
MLELGPFTRFHHRKAVVKIFSELSKLIPLQKKSTIVQKIFFVGKNFVDFETKIMKTATTITGVENPDLTVSKNWFNLKKSLKTIVEQALFSGAEIKLFVKGSRAVRLDRVAEYFRSLIREREWKNEEKEE